MSSQLLLTFAEALERVLTNESTVGKPIECEVMTPIDGLPAGHKMPVATLLARARAVGAGEVTEPVFIVARSMKNWEIVRGESAVVRAHPWDSTPNVAVIASRPGATLASEQSKSLVSDTESLATRLERAKLYSAALQMRRFAMALSLTFGLPIESARDEVERLQRVVAVLGSSQEKPPA